MKFKNIKKKAHLAARQAKIVKSPSNSRTIPAGFKISMPKLNSINLYKFYSLTLKAFVVFIFITAVIVVGLDFQKNLELKQDIDSQREVLKRELNFWENFISEHQNYRDAYFQASILEYRLGNTSKSKMYTEKGLMLDPNSQEGRKTEEILSR